MTPKTGPEGWRVLESQFSVAMDLKKKFNVNYLLTSFAQF